MVTQSRFFSPSGTLLLSFCTPSDLLPVKVRMRSTLSILIQIKEYSLSSDTVVRYSVAYVPSTTIYKGEKPLC